ncbi:carbohydrate kinase (plasmid) [Bartonella sp. HY329]|uniref:carbohydrate kinase family protein n=1 Tax=unclassified Bartonella TaxID=2645622 RepID=UPI0021CA1A73|nr:MULTISPECIES: carbohydrate kinase [unclassified Bartonella]UXM96610.1 carbohydrate kinase [Bartonella sp. HY329]UXN10933.1 carbohydrate kinase [Bartonella sp. HY328]
MILCCGESLIDMLPVATHNGESAFLPVVGGSVFNSAVSLGRLGIQTGFFSGLSHDFFGKMLCDTLDEAKVDYSFATLSDRPTTLAFVKMVGQHAQYAFFDENTAGRMLHESDMPVLDEHIKALLFGCISLISEPCGSVYEALMTKASRENVIYLDPNIRVDFIKDRQKHLDRLSRMIRHSDIVKLSNDDLKWFADDVDEKVLAQEWLNNGAKLVVITKGADGMVAYSQQFCVEIESEKVEIVDTVGAGDTVNAGILASLEDHGLLNKQAITKLNEAQIYEALHLAKQVAAITVARAGANPPWRHEL